MMQNAKCKVLIVGGDGMAGSMIRVWLSEKGHDVYTTTRRDATDKKGYFFDAIENVQGLVDIIVQVKPQFVINCIGVLNQFAEEHKAHAILINAHLPHFIDEISKEYDFKLIHISTDCVFSGNKGQYIETDIPDASSFYGRSKSLGEVVNDKNLTFRTSIIGPDPNENGIGLFNWYMKEKGEMQGFTRVIWTGVTTLQLAKSIEKSFAMNISGLYHLVNDDSIDKYHLLLLFQKYMKKSGSITQNDTYISDKSLVNTRTDYNFDIPNYEQMVDEMSAWIEKHKDLYGTLF